MRSNGGGLFKMLVILAILVVAGYFLWKSGIVKLPK